MWWLMCCPSNYQKKNTIAHSTWNQREFRIDILISPIKYVLTNAIFFLLKLKYIRITIFYQYHAQNNTSNNIPLGVFIKLFSFLLFIWWLIRLKHIQLYFFIRWDYAHFLKIFIFAVPGRCSDGLNYLIDIWLFFWTNENFRKIYIANLYFQFSSFQYY